MEIEEHPPGQGMPARRPVALCECRIHTPTYGLEYGVNVEHMARMLVSQACNLYVSSHIPRQPH